MTMIAKTMHGVAQGHKWREKEREMTPRMDGVGLEASQHADMPREERPEELRQLLPHRKPKLQLKLQPETTAPVQTKVSTNTN